ncbi:MAG: hypothetical protein KGH63_01480 [Candidatus Micrarchaeota archaeon]|nr:hypothetical protein [Candidatus Micrarchaeota archaeon]
MPFKYGNPQENKKGKEQPLDWEHPTHAEKHASGYITDSFYFIFQQPGDNTSYHLMGTSPWAMEYDAGSAYRQVISAPSMAGIEVNLPKPLSQLQPGDQVMLGGQAYSVSQPPDLVGGTLILSKGGKELVLQDGARVNLVGTGDPDYNWYVSFGAQNLKEAVNGGSFSPAATTLWLYNQDTFTGQKYIANDASFSMPSFMKGNLTYNGLIYNETTPIQIDGLSSTDYPVDVNGSRQILHLKLMQIKAEGNFIVVNSTSGNSRYGTAVDALYLSPSRNSYLFRPMGADNYSEVPATTPISIVTEKAGLGDIVSFAMNAANSQLTFSEAARPSTYPNQVVPTVQSILPFTEYSKNVDTDTYRFKKNDAAQSLVEYQGLGYNQPHPFELPLVTERGSHWTDVSTTSASFQYSREIAQAQWTIDGITIPLSSVRQIGAISPASMEIQNYPNPFTAM